MHKNGGGSESENLKISIIMYLNSPFQLSSSDAMSFLNQSLFLAAKILQTFMSVYSIPWAGSLGVGCIRIKFEFLDLFYSELFSILSVY